MIDAEGDAEAAAQLLREKGLAKAATRTDRENAEGAVSVLVEGIKLFSSISSARRTSRQNLNNFRVLLTL